MKYNEMNSPFGGYTFRIFMAFMLMVLLLCVSCGGSGPTIPDEPDEWADMDPRFIGGIKTTCSEDIAISGDTLYIADGPGGLKVVDISDKEEPRLLKSIPTDYAVRVYIYQNHLYLCDASSGIRVWSIADPTDPLLTYEEDTHWATSMAFNDGYLYVGDYFSGFRIYSVADPSNPDLVKVQEQNRVRDIAVMDDTLLISDAPLGPAVYDIVSPGNPIWAYTNEYGETGNHEDIIGHDGFAIIARNDEASRISVWYIGDLLTIGLASSQYPARFIDSITASDDLLVCSCGEEGVMVFDISNLPGFSKIWELGTPAYTRRSKIDGEFLYVADMSNVAIYDCSEIRGDEQ